MGYLVEEEAGKASRDDGVVEVEVPGGPHVLKPVELGEVRVRVEHLRGRIQDRCRRVHGGCLLAGVRGA